MTGHMIFDKKVEISLYPLFKLLDSMGIISNDIYVINTNAFNKMVQLKLYESFQQDILQFYLPQYRFYVYRPFTYNSFTTLVRQLCKYIDYPFATSIVYEHSKHTIVYYLPKMDTNIKTQLQNNDI